MAKLTQNEVQERISKKSNNKVKIISKYYNLSNKNKMDGIEFNRTQVNDKIKNDFAKNHKINLLRISYKEIDLIEEILKKTFNDYRKDR